MAILRATATPPLSTQPVKFKASQQGQGERRHVLDITWHWGRELERNGIPVGINGMFRSFHDFVWTCDNYWTPFHPLLQSLVTFMVFQENHHNIGLFHGSMVFPSENHQKHWRNRPHFVQVSQLGLPQALQTQFGALATSESTLLVILSPWFCSWNTWGSCGNKCG